jgi:hypothetical protein
MADVRRGTFIREVAELVQLLQQGAIDVDSVLDELTESAATSVPGARHAAITVADRDGKQRVAGRLGDRRASSRPNGGAPQRAIVEHAGQQHRHRATANDTATERNSELIAGHAVQPDYARAPASGNARWRTYRFTVAAR